MTISVVNSQLNKLPYLVVAHLLILLGYTLERGAFFHQAQLWLLLLGWLFLLFILLKKKKFELTFNFPTTPLNLLLLANLISFILFYFFDGGIYLFSLKFIAMLLFFLYFVRMNFLKKSLLHTLISHFIKNKFIYLIVSALLLRLVVIYFSPAPHIDVYWVLDGGANSLISASNPYSADFLNPYSAEERLIHYGDADWNNDKYTYLPAILSMTTVSKLFFGDVRIAHLFAVFGSAAIIYFLLRKRFKQSPEIPELASLLILYLPLSLYIIEHAWVDQLSIFFVFLFVFLFLKGFKFLPYLILGVLLATKQTMWALIPFLLRLKDINFRKVIIAGFVFILFISPFIVWSFWDFFYDTVIWHIEYEPAFHSLTFYNLNKIYFHQNIFYPIFSALSILFLFIFLLFRMKRDLRGVILSTTIFLLAVYLLRQGFLNYYNGISNLVILLITLELYQLNDPGQNSRVKQIS